MSTPPQIDVRRDAITYVEAVVARAEGAPAPEPEPPAAPRGISRLIPAFVKRFVIRTLITLNRHPFDHLSHPMRVDYEHQIAELRAAVHAANRRADQAYHTLQRARPEFESWRRAIFAAIADLETEVRSLRERLDELETRR